MRCFLRLPSALVTLLFAAVPLLAQGPLLQIGFDTDNNPATGCGFDPGTGNIQAGVDLVLEVQVDTMTMIVTSTAYRLCDGGVFGAPIALGGGWPVGVNNGLNGADVVEASLPVNLFPQGARDMPFYGGAQSPNGSDDLLARFNFAAAIPTLGFWMLLFLVTLLCAAAIWIKRRDRLTGRMTMAGLLVLVLSGFAGIPIILDGEVSDWGQLAPTATDVTGEPGTTNATDIAALYLCGFEGTMYVRMDLVDLASDVPPNAADDNYFVYGHTSVTVPASLGLLANDDGGMFLAVQPGVFATAKGGQVELFADGSFTYTSPGPNDPMPPITGDSDSFSYNIVNGPAKMTSATATLTYERLVWFVDNTFAGVEDGSQSAPFNTLAEMEAAAGVGDILFVFYGNGTDTGMNQGIVLQMGQDLVGQPAGLFIDVDGGGPGGPVTIIAPGPNRPVLSAGPSTDVVFLDENNLVTELSLIPLDYAGIAGGDVLDDGLSLSSARTRIRTYQRPERQRLSAGGSPGGVVTGDALTTGIVIDGVDINPDDLFGQGIYIIDFPASLDITNVVITGSGIGIGTGGLDQRINNGIGPPVPGGGGEGIYIESSGTVTLDNIEIYDMLACLYLIGFNGPLDVSINHLTIDTGEGEGMYAELLANLEVTGTNNLASRFGPTLTIYETLVGPLGGVFDTITATEAFLPLELYDLTGQPIHFTGAINILDAIDDGVLIEHVANAVTFGGPITVNGASGNGVKLQDNDGAMVFDSTLIISNTGDDGLEITDPLGSNTFRGDVMITQFADDGLDLQGSLGINRFEGRVDIIGDGEWGIEFNGDNGGVPTGSTVFQDLLNIESGGSGGILFTDLHNTFTFDRVQIGLNPGASVGVTFPDCTLFGPLTMADFDLTSTATNDVGIDLFNLAGGQIVRFGDDDPNGNASSIVGVDEGIIFIPATDAIFTFGDGENVIDITSVISAAIPLSGFGSPMAGTYNVSDAGF